MADATVYCFYALPWLRIPKAITFGAVTVAPLGEVISEDDPRLATVTNILSTYRGLGGAPLSPALMWPTGSHPLELAEDGVTSVLAHRDWLSAAAIMGNQYLSPLDAPFSDANADGFGQRFTVGTEHIALTKRRRDGQSVDGWPIATLATQMPLSANPAHQFDADLALLDAFAALPSRTDLLAEQLLEAIPLFNQANRLSERTTLVFDLVFLGGALERLFGISGPGVAEKLADGVSTLFDPFHHETTNWQNLAVSSGRLHPDQGPWVKRWVREFYAHRSAIHGGTPHSSDWTNLWHGLIATEVFSLSAKVMFDRDGTRPLTASDASAANALDGRIEGLAKPGTDPANEWWEALQAADHRTFVNEIAEALDQQGRQ